MTTFFLIRHASCDGLGRKLWGRTPGVCLNEKGRLEARHLIERFRGTTLDAIYSSPLERALETAETIGRELKLEVNKDPAFNEIDFGDWTGKTFDQLSGDECWQRFNTVRSITRIPGGESFLEVQTRIVTELERLSVKHGDAHVGVVSHADVIKAALAYFAATPIDSLHQFEISPCSVNVIELDKV
jgi:broad specificity phosphatase PhoE